MEELELPMPLPPDWTSARHVRHYSEVYMHTGSHVLLLTRPHAMPARNVEELQLPPIQNNEQMVVAALSESARLPLVELVSQVESPAAAEDSLSAPFATFEGGDPQLTPLPRVWSAEAVAGQRDRPMLRYNDFRCPLRLSVSPSEAVVCFLRTYCWLVLGTVVELRERSIGWESSSQQANEEASGLHNTPCLAECHVDGLCVGRAIRQRSLASAAAAEEALLRICPLRWEAELRHPDVWPTVVSQGGLLIPRTILSVDRLRELKLDDDKILDLDASISKHPAAVFSDFAAHRFGSLLHSSTHEVVLRKLSWVPQQHKCKVYCFTTRLAHHIGTAEHVSRRRALQASKLALLRAAHPHIRLWVDLVNEYAPYAAGPVAGPVRGSGSSQTSQTARQLLESDRRTQKSSRMLEREGAPARRTPMPGDKEGGDSVAAGGSGRAGTSGATEEVGGEPTDEGGAAAGPRRRMLPGAGAGFVTKWQQQYRIEALRRQKMEAGGEATTDTDSIRQMDEVKEREDESVRQRLRQAMAQLDAMEVTEDMRLNEPTPFFTMQHGDAHLPGAASSDALVGVAQGADAAGQPGGDASGAAEAADDRPAKRQKKKVWAPWKPGTRGHDALRDIAARGAAAPRAAAKAKGRSGELRLLG